MRPENYSRPYSSEEDEFIEMNTHRKASWVAKKLGRPVQGLRVRMIELGVSNLHLELGTYSAKGLAEVIGVSHEAVRRWIQTKGLKAEKKSRWNIDEEHMLYHITPEDFWKWAEKNKDFLEFNKIERNALLPEPDWVEEERKNQFGKPAKQKPFTPEEDNRLFNLYYSGMKQKDIAIYMNRTQSSVEKRLKRLREAGYGRGLRRK